jgi:hypothetical protein
MFCILCADATAQLSGETAVEGYAFDAGSLRPLANVTVIVQEMYPDGVVASYGTTTDGNGFYSAHFAAVAPLLNSFIQAFCSTRKGIVSSTISLYADLQAVTYQRNVYISLPSRQTACIPQ